MGQQRIKKGILKNLDKNYNENTKSVGCNTHTRVRAHTHTHTHTTLRGKFIVIQTFFKKMRKISKK